MHMEQPSDSKIDIKCLVAACLQNHSESALSEHIKATHWEHLGRYLQPTTIAQGQVLISQGASDRTVYFVESGSLSVHLRTRRVVCVWR